MEIRRLDDVDVHFFDGPTDWAGWLAAHHAEESEVWVGFRRAHVVPRGLTWADAVVEALRYGWIDSAVKRIDDTARRQRFTPRKPGSTWSAVNLATVERLVAEGRMEPAGLAVYEARRADQERVASFESDEVSFDAVQQAAIAADPRALAFWEAATPGYRKVVKHWVASAKQQATRDKRLAQLVQCCADGELVPFQRYGTPPTWLARARAARDVVPEQG